MNNQYSAPGPIFEPGPGWGGKLKKWSKKYILGGDCTLCRATRYVLLFGMVVLVVAWSKFNPPPPVVEENKITETVRTQDGQTHLARRMLAKYLEHDTAVKLTKAQKVFIETVLREKITANLFTGQTVEMPLKEIKQTVEQSKLLTPLQIKKWEFYAEVVNI